MIYKLTVLLFLLIISYCISRYINLNEKLSYNVESFDSEYYNSSSICSGLFNNVRYDNDIEICKMNCLIKSDTYFLNREFRKEDDECKYMKKYLTIDGVKAISSVSGDLIQYSFVNGEYIKNKRSIKSNEEFNITSEQVEIKISYRKSDWYYVFIQKYFKIRNKSERKLSVHIIMFDAGSRYVLKRQIPKSISFLNYLTKNYSFYDMLRFNIIGYNSKPNWVPLFYGVDENNCNVSRKIIFEDFEKSNYVTIRAEAFFEPNKDFYCKNNYSGPNHVVELIPSDRSLLYI